MRVSATISAKTKLSKFSNVKIILAIKPIFLINACFPMRVVREL